MSKNLLFLKIRSILAVRMVVDVTKSIIMLAILVNIIYFVVTLAKCVRCVYACARVFRVRTRRLCWRKQARWRALALAGGPGGAAPRRTISTKNDLVRFILGIGCTLGGTIYRIVAAYLKPYHYGKAFALPYCY